LIDYFIDQKYDEGRLNFIFIQNVMLNKKLKSDYQKSSKKSKKSQTIENTRFSAEKQPNGKFKYNIRTLQSHISVEKHKGY
jgi:phage/plasmid-associated DNA primase